MIRSPSSLMPSTRHRRSSLLVASAVCLLAIPCAALAGPRVGVVAISKDNLSNEQLDDIAYDVAGALATQIEGEAIAGTSVRDLLADGVPADCEQRTDCGRRIAATLKTDEALFLVVKKTGKKDYAVSCHRVARDPDRIPSEGELVLSGNKAKRAKAVTDLVASLYPAGSVVAWVEPPPPPPVDEIAEKKKKKVAASSGSDGLIKKWWFWTAVAGGAVVVGGVVAGVVIAAQPGPSAPSVMLPP